MTMIFFVIIRMNDGGDGGVDDDGDDVDGVG